MNSIRIQNVYAELLKSLIKPNLPGWTISKSLITSEDSIIPEICGKSVDRIIDENFDLISADLYDAHTTTVVNGIIKYNIYLKCKLPQCTPIYIKFSTDHRYVNNNDYIFPIIYVSNGYTYNETHKTQRVPLQFEIEYIKEYLKQHNLELKYSVIRPVLRVRRENQRLSITPRHGRYVPKPTKKKKVHQVIHNIPQHSIPESPVVQDLALLIKQASKINVNQLINCAPFLGITSEGEKIVGAYAGYWEHVVF